MLWPWIEVILQGAVLEAIFREWDEADAKKGKEPLDSGAEPAKGSVDSQ